MSKLVLSKYPHLRQMLKNDPVANQQFNQAMSEVRNGFVGLSHSTETDVRRATASLNALKDARAADQVRLKDQDTVITLLGEAIEPQLHLRPYTQDIADDSHYEVKFSAHQVREILRLHWHLIAVRAEAIIRGNIEPTPDDDENE